MFKPITYISRLIVISILTGLAVVACNPDIGLQEPTPTNQSARLETTANLRLYAGLIAESLENPATVPEVYQRVLMGYEGHSSIPLSFLLGGTMPNAKASKFKGKAKAPLFEKQFRQEGLIANKSGIVSDLVQAVTEQQVELYWPYWQEWDGHELPTISYTPEEGTTESVGFKLAISKKGKIKLEQVRVDDDYAFAHPTWILRKHTPADPNSKISGRFLPSFMQGPKLTFIDSEATNPVKVENESDPNEQLPYEDYDGGDPGYYYGPGPPNLGPGFVEGPTNGTADVNEIYIEHIRTNGSNFRDIFGGGDNDIIFHLGDQKYPTQGQTSKLQLSIDRWAGRKGVWRKPNALWDENWSPVERDQYIGIETVNSGMNKEITIGGSIKLLSKINGSVVTKADGVALTSGNEAGFEITPFSWSVKWTTKNEYLVNSRELNRRIFIAGNTGNVEQQGMLDGVGVRFGGSTRNSGVYYTLKMRSKNFANGF